MLSKLLLIILFLAIPTAAYADGWILWAHTSSLRVSTRAESTTIRVEGHIHGFTSLELCKVEASKQAAGKHGGAKSALGDQVGKLGTYGFLVTMKTKDGAEAWLNSFNWTCYPSNFDPRVK